MTVVRRVVAFSAELSKLEGVPLRQQAPARRMNRYRVSQSISRRVMASDRSQGMG